MAEPRDRRGRDADGFRSMAEVLRERTERIRDNLERRARGEVIWTHVPTGLRTIDDLFGGMEIGVATLVTAHTGEGKTSLLARFLRGAGEADLGALGWLLEDPEDRVADRYLAEPTGLDTRDLGRLKLAPDVPKRLEALRYDWGHNVRVKFGHVTPEDIVRVAERTAKAGGILRPDGSRAPLRFVAVDYAQAFADDEGSMEAVCAWTARSLNELAGEYGFAAAFGSQAKTDVIRRGRLLWEQTNGEDASGFRPGKGDAKWSQRLEEYTKANWSWFREGRWRRHLGDTGAKDDRGELNVNKQNYGPEGQAILGWHGPTTSIFDLDRKKK